MEPAAFCELHLWKADSIMNMNISIITMNMMIGRASQHSILQENAKFGTLLQAANLMIMQGPDKQDTSRFVKLYAACSNQWLMQP